MGGNPPDKTDEGSTPVTLSEVKRNTVCYHIIGVVSMSIRRTGAISDYPG